MKITQKIALAIFVIGISIIGLSSIIYYYHFKRVAIARHLEIIQEESSRISRHIDNLLIEKTRTATTLGHVPLLLNDLLKSNNEFDGLDEEARVKEIADLNERWLKTQDASTPFIQRYLSNPVANHLREQQSRFKGEYGEIFLTNRYGVLVSSTAKLTTLAHARKYWWKAAYNEGTGSIFFDDRGYDDSVGGYVLGVVVPLWYGPEIVGILKCNLNVLGAISNILLTAQEKESEVLKLARSGGLIVYENGKKPLSTLVTEPVRKKLEHLVGGSVQLNIDETAQFVGFSPVKITKGKNGYNFGGSFESIDHKKGNRGEIWYVVKSEPMAAVLTRVQRMVKLLLFIGLGLCIFLAIVALFMGRSMAKPFLRLVEATKEVGKGQFDKKIGIISQDEVGELSKYFNQMMVDLKNSTASREELKKEIIERKQVEKKISHQTLMLKGVNKVLQDMIKSESEESLGELCLSVVEDITKSKIGLIGEIGADGLFHDIAISLPGWEACRMIDQSGHRKPPGNFRIHGIYGRVLKDGKGFFTNDPASHFASIGLPTGHPPLTSFLGVPLIQKDRIIGMIAVGNRDGGYSAREQEALETIAPSITEALMRKRAELERSRIYDMPGLLIMVAKPDTTIVRVSSGWEHILGYSLADKVGKSFLDFVHPDDIPKSESETESVSDGSEIEYFENRYRRDDGTYLTLSWAASVDPSTGLLYAFAQDVTDQKNTEAALRESEERFRTVADFTYDWESWISPNRKYIYVSPSFERITGYKPNELLQDHRFFETIVHPDDRGKAYEHLRNHDNNTEVFTIDIRIIARNGETRWISHICQPVYDSNGNFCGRRSSNRDITDQKKTEKQLRQAQKMEAVGRLAGGVAHDYNNALSVIIGFTELAINKVDPTGPLRANLDEVLAAAQRATKITRQLLAFARKQTIAPKVLDLNENVKGMLKMLRRLIGEDIDLAWFPRASLWPVKMDPAQIDQILANLCVNARDAIAGVGKVTIETRNATFDETYCADHAGFVPGEFVLLAVSDNGCGIEKEVLENIFDPFFTTKTVDKGTGLGLATVYGIVKQNNGFINVYSEPGKGTTIKIYMSRHEGKVVEIQRESTAEIPSGRGETVLLVEDDLSLLKLAEKILDSLGYTVLTAGTPGEAMGLAEELAGDIHLLITDVIMPEMNGHDLAQRLQSHYPNLKCMFMSGYTANVIAHHGVLEEEVHFIQKPFTRRDLAKTVRKALDE